MTTPTRTPLAAFAAARSGGGGRPRFGRNTARPDATMTTMNTTKTNNNKRHRRDVILFVSTLVLSSSKEAAMNNNNASFAKEDDDEETFQSPLIKALLEQTEENKALRKLQLETKYCLRQSQMGVGDCADIDEESIKRIQKERAEKLKNEAASKEEEGVDDGNASKSSSSVE
jgi:hypothetical protein